MRLIPMRGSFWRGKRPGGLKRRAQDYGDRQRGLAMAGDREVQHKERSSRGRFPLLPTEPVFKNRKKRKFLVRHVPITSTMPSAEKAGTKQKQRLRPKLLRSPTMGGIFPHSSGGKRCNEPTHPHSAKPLCAAYGLLFFLS